MIPSLALLAMVAVGLLAARRTRSTEDYLVAGRRLGAVRAGLSVAASAFSGFVFLGGAGLTAEVGAGSLFIIVPAGFTAALLCRTAGRRLALIAAVAGARTLPEAIRFRFGGRAAEALAAVAILGGSIVYLGVQLAALARAASFFQPQIAPGWALLLGFGALMAYGLAGGMLASVNTDVLQAVIMVAAAVAAFAWAAGVLSAPPGLVGAVADAGPGAASLLDPVGVLGASTGFGLLLLFSVGTLGQPHMLHKFLMLRSPATLRLLPAVIGTAQGLSLLVWIGLGGAAVILAATGALDAVRHTDETALAVFAAGGAPAVLTGLVAAAVVSAVLSTADAFLNLGAAALARDLPRALGIAPRPGLRPVRLAGLLTGVAALAVAGAHLAGGGLIAWLGTLGFGAFAAALAPTMALGLSWKRVTGAAAAASMGVGLGALLLLEVLRPNAAPGPAVLALGAAFLTLVVVSLLTPRRPLPDQVRLAMTL